MPIQHRKWAFIKRYITILCIGLACSAIMTALLRANILEWIELKSLDFRFLCRGVIPVSDKIVIIGTDEEALDKIQEPFVFWSPYFAEIIKAVTAGGSKAMGLDFLQTISLKKKVDGVDLDGVMADALGEAENVIMINLLRWDAAAGGLTALNPQPRYLYASDPDNVGFSNLTIDKDGFVRRQKLILNDVDGNAYAYLALKVVSKALNSNIEKKGDRILVGDYQIPINSNNEMLINFAGPSGTFPVVSFYKIWKLAREGNIGFFRKYFKDKIVLIGPGNIYSQDYKPTPFYRSRYFTGTRQTLGIEIVANVINTILERRFITSLEFYQTVLIILFMGILTSVITFTLSSIAGGIIVTALAAGYFCLSILLFRYYNVWLNVVCPLDCIPLTYAAIFVYRYMVEDKEKRKIKKVFKHYVSEEVVDEMLKYPDKIPLGGKRVQATVLFSDIRGFTSLSENYDPQRIVSVLNTYFSVMVDIIFKNKGTLDKYLGDGILAFFGAPIVRSEHADLAVTTAIEMVSKMDELNRELALQNPLRIGIGIHSGEAIVGNIGSHRKMEYTIIGDTVNTASRIEGLTKELKTDILITDETLSRLKGNYQITLEKEVVLRGKTRPTMIYRVKAYHT